MSEGSTLQAVKSMESSRSLSSAAAIETSNANYKAGVGVKSKEGAVAAFDTQAARCQQLEAKVKELLSQVKASMMPVPN
jgi:hypothetical protein